MMRVLVITYELPPVGGGGGQAALDVSRELVRRRHEIHILTAHLEGLPRRETLDGIHIIRVPSARRLPYKADLLAMSGFVIAGLWAGLLYTKKFPPDIIHVHFAVPSGPVAWSISHYTRIPYVLTAHLGDVPQGVPEKTDRWFRWIYPFTPPIWRDAAQVVAVSEYTRQLASRHYPVNPIVVPNGVDLSLLIPKQLQVGDPPQIIFIGRFVPQKNPIQLVRMLSDLKNMDWKCTMVGDGPLYSKVRDEIKNSGLENRISLTGWVTPEEVIHYLTVSDILFMPSLSEGLPIVGVQSLAMALAIVASKVGGFIDIVENGKNGFIVEPGNTNGYLLALRELLSDRSLLNRFRQASREKAQEFDIKRVAQAYEDIFFSIVQKTKE
jgi:glycosyltransferase involved in cell wall biosynthesis